MEKEFRLADPGEGIHEAEIVEILISEGDQVEEEQVILVIETDKAAVEVPSPMTGIIKKINVSEGNTVEVGDVLIIFEVEADEDEDAEVEKKETTRAERTSEKKKKEEKRRKRRN
jgi:pyruvate dehydrogenase E2 component (dihydrolipoamide acetyltransferase)